MKSVQSSARCLWRAGFEKEKSFEVLRLEKKNGGMIDDKSGDDDTGEVR